MLSLLLTLPAALAQLVSPRLPLDSPSQCPTTISQSPTLTYPPRAMTTTTYTTITPTLTAPRTTPLSWLPFPTLRECAEVTLRWAGGLPPFSVQVTARSESHTLFANVTAREADWVCRYKTGNWLAFAVAGEDGMWMQTEVEQFVETGPGECGAWDPPVLFNDSYTPEWGQGAEWTGDEGDYEDGTGEEEEGDEDDGTRVGGAVFSSPWSAARITRTSNSTLPTYSLLDNVVTSSTITSTTSPRTRPLGPIPLSTVWHQPTASVSHAWRSYRRIRLRHEHLRPCLPRSSSRSSSCHSGSRSSRASSVAASSSSPPPISRLFGFRTRKESEAHPATARPQPAGLCSVSDLVQPLHGEFADNTRSARPGEDYSSAPRNESLDVAVQRPLAPLSRHSGQTQTAGFGPPLRAG